MGVRTLMFGPHAWRVFHGVCKYVDGLLMMDGISNDDGVRLSRLMAEWLNLIGQVLPCTYCRISFKEFYGELMSGSGGRYESENVRKSRMLLKKGDGRRYSWRMYLLHDRVNLKLWSQLRVDDPKRLKWVSPMFEDVWRDVLEIGSVDWVVHMIRWVMYMLCDVRVVDDTEYDGEDRSESVQVCRWLELLYELMSAPVSLPSLSSWIRNIYGKDMNKEGMMEIGVIKVSMMGLNSLSTLDKLGRYLGRAESVDDMSISSVLMGEKIKIPRLKWNPWMFLQGLQKSLCGVIQVPMGKMLGEKEMQELCEKATVKCGLPMSPNLSLSNKVEHGLTELSKVKTGRPLRGLEALRRICS